MVRRTCQKGCLQQRNQMGKQAAWAGTLQIAAERVANPDLLPPCRRSQSGGLEKRSGWQRLAHSRRAQQLRSIGRVRLGEQHECGARQRVEAVQVKRVGLHQLQGTEGRQGKGRLVEEGQRVGGHAGLGVGYALTCMPLLSGTGDSCADMPHMPNLQDGGCAKACRVGAEQRHRTGTAFGLGVQATGRKWRALTSCSPSATYR